MPTLVLLAFAVLAGGLREPRLAAAGGAAAALLAAASAPLPLGPAVWWLPWLAWAALSCLLSPQPWAGLPVVARWAAFAAFLALASRWDDRSRRAWLRTLCALGGALAAAALWTGRPYGFGHEMKGLLPPYYNYTVFAVSAAAAAAAAWALHSDAPRGARRAGLWALAAALAGAVLLSRSRGGLLGLGAAGAWLAWRRGGARGLCALLAAAALAGLAFPSAWRPALSKSSRARGEARPEIWRASAALAVEKPWLGEGPGDFAVGFRRRPVPVPGAPARWGLWTPYAHSEPLQAAVETGVVGIVLWLLGLGGALSAALRGGRGPAPREAARAALVATGAQLLVDNMLQLTGLSFLYAALLAAAGPRSADAEPRLPRAGALALAAFALAGALPAVLAAPPSGASPDVRLGAARVAVRLYPADAERREDLAWQLQLIGDFDEAAGQWAEAERLSPFNAIYPWRRGVLLQSEGRLAEAEAAVRRALADEPGFLGARADLVAILAAQGRRGGAAEELVELRRRAALPAGIPESGYESVVSRLEPSDLRRAEAALAAAPGRKGRIAP